MTKYATMHLDQDSLHNLAAVLGARWQYLGGADLWDRLSASQAFIVTDGGALTINADIEYLDFEDFEDNYSYLRAIPGAQDLATARSRGYLYYFHTGQTVTDVLIVRDKISEIRYGHTAWEFSFDSAIIFQLQHAVIGITKYPHSELFLITHAPELGELDVISRFDEWEDELGVEHITTRTTIPIRELVTATARPNTILESDPTSTDPESGNDAGPPPPSG